MTGIVAIVAIALALGLAFLGLSVFGGPSLQRRGPWLVGASACVTATLIIATHDDGVANFTQHASRHQVKDLFITAGVMALLASEAMFVNRWVSATVRDRAKAAYLVVFTCTTLIVWFLTAMAFWAVLPGS